MKYEISAEQIKSIKDTFFELNVPVKTYAGLQDLLDKLPELVDPKKK